MRRKNKRRSNSTLILMVIIPLIVIFIFQYIPLYGLQIAFKNYNPLGSIWESEWVGFKYFEQFFSYYKFKDLLANTVLLNLYDVLLTPIPLIFAMCINYVPSRNLANFIQHVAIMPHFISVVVICSLIMRFLSPDGLINEIYTSLGNDSVNFLAQGKFFRSIYVWSGVWQNVGFSAIIYISALADVPRELHEAADIDGANIFKKMLYIDLPTVLPLFAVNLVFRFGALMSNNYEKILLLQNNANLKYSQVISTYTYEVAFKGIIPQYSLATAIGIITAIVNMALLLIIKKATRRWEHLDE